MKNFLIYIKRLLKLATRPGDILAINPTRIHGLNLNLALDRLADQQIFQGQVILDIGAHHGETMSKFKRQFPKAIIHSFEPFISAFKVLEKQVNKKDINIFVHNFGFSDRNDCLNFHVNSGSPTNSLLPLHESASKTWAIQLKSVEMQTCQFRTLDSWLDEQGIDKIALLKLDVQGAEYLVLNGGIKSFEKNRFTNILIEVIVCTTYDGQKPLSHYFEFFETYGFKLTGIYDIAYSNTGSILQMDLLFQQIQPSA